MTLAPDDEVWEVVQYPEENQQKVTQAIVEKVQCAITEAKLDKRQR